MGFKMLKPHLHIAGILSHLKIVLQEDSRQRLRIAKPEFFEVLT
jgi:hypothetical protein